MAAAVCGEAVWQDLRGPSQPEGAAFSCLAAPARCRAGGEVEVVAAVGDTGARSGLLGSPEQPAGAAPVSRLHEGAAVRTRRLLCAGFSQDGSQFAVGTTAGLAVYETAPVRARWSFEVASGLSDCRVLVAATLFRTSVVAVVAADAEGRGADRVRIWDVNRGSFVGEVRAGPHDVVRGVMLQRELLVMVCERFTRVYDASTLLPKLHLPTAPNPHGLGGLTASGQPPTLCCLGETTGEVRMLQGLADASRITFQAHDKGLRQLALAQDGSLLVTASDFGTKVKVFRQDGRLVHEVRLACQQQNITSLALSTDLRLAGISFAMDPHVYLFHVQAAAVSADAVATAEAESGARPTRAGILPNYCAYFRLPDVDAKGRPQVDVRDALQARVVGPQLAFWGTSLHVLCVDGMIHEVALEDLVLGAPYKELRCTRSTLYLAARLGWTFKFGTDRCQDVHVEDAESSEWELLS